MKIKKGSSVAIGLLGGLVIGIFMNDLVRFVLLGLTFGLIGEMTCKKKDCK